MILIQFSPFLIEVHISPADALMQHEVGINLLAVAETVNRKGLFILVTAMTFWAERKWMDQSKCERVSGCVTVRWYNHSSAPLCSVETPHIFVIHYDQDGFASICLSGLLFASFFVFHNCNLSLYMQDKPLNWTCSAISLHLSPSLFQSRLFQRFTR